VDEGKKEVVKAYSKYYSGICLEVLEIPWKLPIVITDVLGDIRTEKLSNASPEGYRYANPLDVQDSNNDN
jgi:hypothetical protein